MTNVKRLLYPLIALFVILFSSCEKDDDKTFLFPGMSKLEFGYNANVIELTIGNIADQSLEWSASTQDDFLAFSKTSGMLDANEYQTISVSLQRDKISGDSISSSIKLTSSVGNDVDISVFILNYPENKIRLSYRVADAAFDANGQLLYILPSTPDFLDIYDLADKTFKRIALDINQYSNLSFLELMPDGKNLFISQHNYLYQFDITQEIIASSYQFDDYLISATGTPNQKLYLTTDDWNQNFYTLDVSTHQLVLNNIDLEDCYIQVHPSWKYLYGTAYYDDFTKIDIQGETPQVIYSNYSLGEADKLWITGTGQRIITSDKRFLTINPDLPGEDILNSENINYSSYPLIGDVAFDKETNEYYIIFKPSDYYENYASLHVFDETMNPLREIVPEPFLENTNNGAYESVRATPKIIFSNPVDNTIILFSKAESNYENIYGIEIIKSD